MVQKPRKVCTHRYVTDDVTFSALPYLRELLIDLDLEQQQSCCGVVIRHIRYNVEFVAAMAETT